MQKRILFLFLLGSLLLLGCQNKTIDNKIIDSELWPDSKIVVYIPIFSKGEYVSGKCGNTNCEIIFKNVEPLAFEEYASTLIKWGYIVNSARKTEDKMEIYEASNEYFAYVKTTYNTDTKTLTINNSIKDMKK